MWYTSSNVAFVIRFINLFMHVLVLSIVCSVWIVLPMGLHNLLDPSAGLRLLAAVFQWCCGCGESMDPSAGWPWILVQVGVVASRVSGVLWLW